MITKKTWFLTNLIVGGSLLGACTQRGQLPKQPQSALATIAVGSLDAPNYDQIRLSASKTSEPDKKTLEVQASRGQASIQGQVPPGSYSLQLDYLAKGEVTYTSKDCDNPAQYELKSGLNPITIYVCDAAGQRISVDPPEPTVTDTSTNPEQTTGDANPNKDANLDITPVYRKPGADKERGQVAYTKLCSSCHGDKGNGTASGPRLSVQSSTNEAFILRTANTMPPSNPALCDKACAADIASYLFN